MKKRQILEVIVRPLRRILTTLKLMEMLFIHVIYYPKGVYIDHNGRIVYTKTESLSKRQRIRRALAVLPLSLLMLLIITLGITIKRYGIFFVMAIMVSGLTIFSANELIKALRATNNGEVCRQLINKRR